VRKFPAVAIIDKFDGSVDIPSIARRLDTDRATVHHWRWYNTQLSPWAADKYAVKLGFHPSEIWEDWFTS
jgi:hypothetical protein